MAFKDGLSFKAASTIGAELAAYAMKVKLEKMVKQAERNGVVVVVDVDAIAVRFIPASEMTEGADLRSLGVTARVHNACGGSSAGASHPVTHGA